MGPGVAPVVGGDPVAYPGSGHRPRPREASRTLGDLSADPVQLSFVGGQAGGLTHNRATREEVIAFDGIPDPVSEGRRISSRLQEHPDVDDMQLRCALRAAKLHDIEVTTGYLQSHRVDPHVVVTHFDGGQGAFGYCVYPMGDDSTGYF
ncbi:uncharacterized protein LOC119268209 [Triticum dicoccoides]|uniref:uncharacterized protein LOC119268209 n=1 Tax=Triticum dicoccoides TaxID=85692 RepID=UPI0018909E9A|nr:uncharacterized protein LOC119268209 [Triticum dicoccoides]